MHQFLNIADYWSNLSFWRAGIPHFNALVRGERLHLEPLHVASGN